MSIINVISAIGNNSSVYPLLVRDCGIEVPTKVIQTYNQNKKDSPVVAKHALRERSLDEYATTAVWVGGVPLVEAIFNKAVKSKGINGKISYKLLENDQKIEKAGSKIGEYAGKAVAWVKAKLPQAKEAVQEGAQQVAEAAIGG